jgi:hypothetical protein
MSELYQQGPQREWVQGPRWQQAQLALVRPQGLRCTRKSAVLKGGYNWVGEWAQRLESKKVRQKA